MCEDYATFERIIYADMNISVKIYVLSLRQNDIHAHTRTYRRSHTHTDAHANVYI